MHKKDQGKLGEALVIAQCLDAGFPVFTEFGDNSKIDLIIQTPEKLVSVQVKCVGREPGSVNSAKLYLYKSGPNYQFRYSPKDVDYFAVVDMKTKRIAWIPLTESLCESRTLLLHLGEGRATTKTTYFSEYEKIPWTS